MLIRILMILNDRYTNEMLQRVQYDLLNQRVLKIVSLQKHLNHGKNT